MVSSWALWMEPKVKSVEQELLDYNDQFDISVESILTADGFFVGD